MDVRVYKPRVQACLPDGIAISTFAHILLKEFPIEEVVKQHYLLEEDHLSLKCYPYRQRKDQQAGETLSN